MLELEQDRIQSSYISEVIQKRRQAWVNRNIKFKIFKEGDLVMLYNSKLGPHPGKLKLRYIGPFLIKHVMGQGTFLLSDLSGNDFPKPVNGFRLKLFFGPSPISREVGVNFIAMVGTCYTTSIRGMRGFPNQYEVTSDNSIHSLGSDQSSKFEVTKEKQMSRNFLSVDEEIVAAFMDSSRQKMTVRHSPRTKETAARDDSSYAPLDDEAVSVEEIPGKPEVSSAFLDSKVVLDLAAAHNRNGYKQLACWILLCYPGIHGRVMSLQEHSSDFCNSLMVL